MARRRVAESRSGTIIHKLLTSRHTRLSIAILSAFLLLGVWGTSSAGQSSFVKGLQKYIEEGASSVTGSQEVMAAQVAVSITSFTANTGGSSVPDPTPALDATTDHGTAMIAFGPPDTDFLDGFKADQVIQYTVQSDDTIGDIAANFGVSVDTIVWANELKDPNSLRLNQTLKIPPVTGVIHTVQTGDTVAAIASKYKADAKQIVSFNSLSDSYILQAGDELMVPGGELPGPKPLVKSVLKGSGASGIYVSVGNGQCVAFVQAHGFSKMSGNANTWKRYINTPTPVAGAVVVLRGGPYGHVALITAVKPGSVQIVEQNYYGPYIIDHREISLNDRSIVGFIQ